jgi:hypothetical protein
MAFLPDMEINKQGDDLPEAIDMTRDAIGLMGIDMEYDHKAIPEPPPVEKSPRKRRDHINCRY